MALINTSLPNLVQGVSQQPDTLRFDGQCEDQINALSSVSDGLKKRPNSRFLKELISSAIYNGAFVHFINRDKNEKYVLIIDNTTTANTTTVRAFNLLTTSGSSSDIITWNNSSNGTSTFTSTSQYLFVPANQRPRDVLKALTVNDTTFILNTTKNVERLGSGYKSDAHTASAATNKALVFIKQGHHKCRYNIKIKHGSNTFKGTFGVEENTADAKGNVKNQAGRIANKLRQAIAQAIKGTVSLTTAEQEAAFTANGFTVGVVEDIDSTQATEHVIASDGGSGDEAFLYPLFEISRADGTAFEITVSDSKSGTALGVVYKEVGSISDLPTVAPNGFKVKVRGSAEDSEDDYYVKFQTNDSSTTGVSDGGWVEDVGYDQHLYFDSNTLPYRLINSALNTFTLGTISWTTKQAGDEETNPFPSFFRTDSSGNANRAISNLFFYKNRLGFLSEGSVILSEAGEYFNFFRTTVRTLLDSDPIDVNVASTRVTNLKSAVGFQENLVLFGERGQFVLRGGDILTPKTVSIKPVTNYETDTSTTPLELGSYIYFPFTRGSFSGVREFNINANTDTYDSVEITAHVPQYIPSDIMDMAGSTSENCICIVSETDNKNMYVYKYYWEGAQKILASWSKFTFPFSVISFEFIESDLYIIGTKSNKTVLFKLPMEEKLVDTGASFTTYLDIREEGTINNGSITLSFTPESDDEIQVYTKELGNTKAGQLIPSTVNGNVVTVGTDYNQTPVFVGIKYTMSYTFSEQVFRQRANQRKSPSGYQRHFLKGGTLFFDDTASFKVEVTPKARQTYNNIFSSNIVGSTVVGTLPIESGSFSFPIMSSAKDTTIKIVNDSALPGNFQSAEFESFIHTRSKRV